MTSHHYSGHQVQSISREYFLMGQRKGTRRKIIDGGAKFKEESTWEETDSNLYLENCLPGGRQGKLGEDRQKHLKWFPGLASSNMKQRSCSP